MERIENGSFKLGGACDGGKNLRHASLHDTIGRKLLIVDATIHQRLRSMVGVLEESCGGGFPPLVGRHPAASELPGPTPRIALHRHISPSVQRRRR